MAKRGVEEDDSEEIRGDSAINYESKFVKKGEKRKMRVCSRVCVTLEGVRLTAVRQVSRSLTEGGGGVLFL